MTAKILTPAYVTAASHLAAENTKAGTTGPRAFGGSGDVRRFVGGAEGAAPHPKRMPVKHLQPAGS